MPLQVKATARKLKVTTLLDPAPFVELGPIADQAPARTLLTVEVGGRKVTADIATRSLRRAMLALRDYGPDGVVLMLQGVLAASGALEEAGLAAQVKAKPAENADAAVAES